MFIETVVGGKVIGTAIGAGFSTVEGFNYMSDKWKDKFFDEWPPFLTTLAISAGIAKFIDPFVAIVTNFVITPLWYILRAYWRRKKAIGVI